MITYASNSGHLPCHYLLQSHGKEAFLVRLSDPVTNDRPQLINAARSASRDARWQSGDIRAATGKDPQLQAAARATGVSARRCRSVQINGLSTWRPTDLTPALRLDKTMVSIAFGLQSFRLC